MRPGLRTAVSIPLAALLIACTADSPAPPQSEAQSINDHVTFYGVGKVARFQQSMDSTLEDLGPVFFGEIFIAAGGEAAAKAAGKLRVEGKDYPVVDGDVMHFRVGG